MSWVAKATGDMTLSVLDEDEFQVVKVDMLGAGTMKAGTNGAILCRTMNDLTIIAGFSDGKYSFKADDLPYPDDGISPLPWSLHYDEEKRNISIKSGKRTIANKKYSKTVPNEKIEIIKQIFELGLKHLSVTLDD